MPEGEVKSERSKDPENGAVKEEKLRKEEQHESQVLKEEKGGRLRKE